MTPHSGGQRKERYGMKIRTKIASAVGAIALAGGIVAMAGGPAFACTGQCSAPGNTAVTANASVAEYITLSGLTATVDFGTLTAGQASTVDPAEQETVATNDPSGFSLSITPASTAFSDGLAGTIPNSDLDINENGAGWFPFSGSNPMTLATETTSGTYPFSEGWSLNAPNPLPEAGSYSEQFTYLALAS